MGPSMHYSLSLCFDEEFASQLTAYSASMPSDVESSYSLSPKSLPHVTILQFDSEAPLGEEIERFEPIDHGLRLNFGGLTYVPNPGGADVWVEITVFRSTVLAALQANALSMNAQRDIHNAVAEGYRPHVTVAHYVSTPTQLPCLSAHILRASNIWSRLALGRSDEHFQVVELLHIF
jgi:2'-5' RNA ligase